MSTSDVIAIIQTALAIGAFIFAYAEFKRWRVELLGSKKIELAIQLGKTVIQIREAFKAARSPIGSMYKAPEYSPNSTEEEKRQQDRYFEFTERLKRVATEIEKLYEIRWEIAVLFDRDIQEQVKLYNTKYHELENAIRNIYHREPEDGDHEIVYSRSDADEFAKSIHDVTENLLKFAKQYTR